MKYFLLLLLLITCHASPAQHIDSLPIWKQQLLLATKDQERLYLFKGIANAYDQIQSDSAMSFGLAGLVLAKKLNDLNAQIELLDIIGFSCNLTGQTDDALKYYHQALQIAIQLDDKESMATIYQLTSEVYNYIGDLNRFLEYSQKALEAFEQLGDSIGYYHQMSNIGIVHYQLGDYAMAIEYHQKGHDGLKRQGVEPGSLIRTIGKIGECYRLLGDTAQYAYYIHQQINMRHLLEDSLEMAYTDLDVAFYYESIADDDNAIRYFLKSLTFFKESNRVAHVGMAYDGLGRCYYRKGEFKKALAYLLQARDIFRDSGQLDGGEDVWKEIAMTYEKLNRPTDALGALKKYVELRDSSYNESIHQEVTRKEMQFNFDRVQLADSLQHVQEISLSQHKLQRQRILTYASFSGIALVLFTLFVLYRSYRQKQRSNKELAISKARAEQSEQYKQQFLANMSHEIRSPMNAVLGMTRLVLDTPLEPKQRAYLETVEKSSGTLLHIIDDILDLSKVEAGKIELEQISFSIRDVAQQIRELLQEKAAEKNIAFIVNIQPNVPEMLIGDPTRLTQVLLNLTNNAIKFTEQGSVALDIGMAPDGQNIKFTITDTGIGIPRDKLDSIFESFTQAYSSDRRIYGGTGLGLTISKQFVELMGGTLLVTSEEGKGSVFSFNLLLPKGSAESSQLFRKSNQIDGRILNGLKILLVDDHRDNLVVAGDTLRSKASVDITESNNGKDALEKLHLQEFDVILMDVQMPEMDGYETTRRIRQTFPEPKNAIPIIALTASVIRSDLDKCIAAGMNDYISKPFTVAALITTIAKVTGRALEYTTEKRNAEIPVMAKESPGQTFDLSYLRKFCDGDLHRMEKYMRLFLDSAPGFIQDVDLALQRSDFQHVASLMHGFKTKWMMMGMYTSNDLSTRIELECRKEVREEAWIREGWMKLSLNLKDVIQSLDQHLLTHG
jgi:signal transduction histidine kinase/FixJ family two-component response regulator/HPt (histidine-containing phosphotransfer) domain-containing protein